MKLPAALALAVAVGCSGGGAHPAPVGPPVAALPAPDPALAPEPQDDGPPLEERIAAIEGAMNDLAPVASQCWAAAAADQLAVAGRVVMLVTIGKDGHASAVAELDEPGKPVLIRCLADVLGAYAWAPPIRGQTVELPFVFSAPAMQNVIDRRLVPHRAQAGVDVAVLLDQLNTANPATSLLDVYIMPYRRSGPRQIDRTELWVFFTPADVAWAGGAAVPVSLAAGDALWVPAGQQLLVQPGHDAPSKPGIRAMVVIVPGGREGAARAGALPGAATTLPVHGGKFPQPVLVPAAGGTRVPRPSGAATIRVEPGVPSKTVGKELSLLGLELDAGATVPSHVHAGETEMLYVLSGGGTMTVGGVAVPVTEFSVVQLPAGVEHGFAASAATTALQLYTPAGPEQRFKPPKPATPSRPPAKKIR